MNSAAWPPVFYVGTVSGGVNGNVLLAFGVGIRPHKRKNPDKPCGLSGFYPGDDLVSHAVARAVPSALRGLTSVFGMGTGVALSVGSPENVGSYFKFQNGFISEFLQ